MATLDASIPLQAGRAVADPGLAVQQGLQTAGSLMKIQEMVQGVQSSKLKNAYAVNKTAAGLAKEALQVYKRAASKGSPMEAEAAMNAYWRDQGKALVDLFGKEQAETMLQGQHTVDDMTQFYSARGSRAAALGSALGLEKEQGAAARPITPEERAQYGLPADAPYSMTDKGPELIKTPEGGKKPTPQTDLGKLQADYQAGALHGDPKENERIYQQQLANILEKDKGAKKIDPAEAFKLANQLGDDYFTASKEFIGVQDGYSRVLAAGDEPGPAGDLALINAYQKMVDPGVSVRSEEFQIVAQSGAYTERMRAAVQRVLSGERLTPEMRADFMKKAGDLYRSESEMQAQRRDNFTAIAKRAGLNEQDVLQRVAESARLAARSEGSGPGAQVGAGGQGAGPQGGGMEVASQAIPTPQTLEEFNALASGALYNDPDDPPGSPPRVKP